MNKRRRYRSVLVLGTVGILLTGICGFWLHSFRRHEALNRPLIAPSRISPVTVSLMGRQERLNRQLIAALVKGDTHQALALVNKGADPNTPFKPLPPPSQRQLRDDRIHHTSLPNSHCRTAFLMACGAMWGIENVSLSRCPYSPQLVKTMINKGANIRATDEDGHDALTAALLSHHPEELGILLAAGADANARSEVGFTPLLTATDLGSYGEPTLETVRLLLDHGADVNGKGYKGETPLFGAVPSWHPLSIASLLIERGAEVDARDENGSTPLIVAAFTNPATVDLLLKHGADVNARNRDGLTALEAAAGFDNDKGHNSPTSRKILLMLLAHGANPNLPNTSGKTLLQRAQENQCPDIVALLKQAGAKE